MILNFEDHDNIRTKSHSSVILVFEAAQRRPLRAL